MKSTKWIFLDFACQFSSNSRVWLTLNSGLTLMYGRLGAWDCYTSALFVPQIRGEKPWKISPKIEPRGHAEGSCAPVLPCIQAGPCPVPLTPLCQFELKLWLENEVASVFFVIGFGFWVKFRRYQLYPTLDFNVGEQKMELKVRWVLLLVEPWSAMVATKASARLGLAGHQRFFSISLPLTGGTKWATPSEWNIQWGFRFRCFQK